MNYMPWIVNGALNGRAAEGNFPLIVISHPTPGTRFSYHNLAEELARQGFIVAAPHHGRDNMNNMDDMFTWSQLERRVREISATIDAITADKEIANILDAKRIGLVGFGSGGSAALLAGGALPNCSGWANYCGSASSSDPYCAGWGREKVGAICQNFPLRKSLADQRIKAVAIVAPGYGMFFDKNSFAHFYPPVLLVGAGKDAFNNVALHCEPLARILGKKANYLDLPQADAGALMAPCPDAIERELPELCNSATPEERQEIHITLLKALCAFFSHYLKTDNLPSIPPPPNLEVPLENGPKEKPLPQKKGARRQPAPK